MSRAQSGIRGESVVLRELTTDDLEALRRFVNEPDVARLTNTYRPISDVEHAEWWQRAMADRNSVWFGLEEIAREPVALIGTCCLVAIDWIGRQAELRIRIGERDAWGRGLGREACALLIEFAFGDLNLERIGLRVYESNDRARRTYEKLGFVVEGCLRRGAYVRGRPTDVILMGLLRDEWRK